MKDILTSITERLGDALVNDHNKLNEATYTLTLKDLFDYELEYDLLKILKKDDKQLYNELEKFVQTNVKIQQLWAHMCRKENIESDKKPHPHGWQEVTDSCGGTRRVYMGC